MIKIKMNIEYKSIKIFQAEKLERLFLSVDWESGNFPEKLMKAMENSSTVLSAWDENRLIGLANALDDSVMTAYMHYVLVDPEYHGCGIGKELLQRMKEIYNDYITLVLVSYTSETGFYESCGFEIGKEETPMFITKIHL